MNHSIKTLGLKLAITAGLLVWAQSTSATTALKMQSVEGLTRYADVVAHGKVGVMSSFMENDQIFTQVELEVAELYKGEAALKKLTLLLYGGTAGGKRTRVIGAPCLSSGEEVVLFLKADSRGSYGVVNLAEGKFGVVTEKDGTKRVERRLDGIRYLTKSRAVVPETLSGLREAVLKSR